MRATMMYAAGDVRVESVPDATLVEPTDALIRITRACICGSDLWPYNLLERSDKPRPMGHDSSPSGTTLGAAGPRGTMPGDESLRVNLSPTPILGQPS